MGTTSCCGQGHLCQGREGMTDSKWYKNTGNWNSTSISRKFAARSQHLDLVAVYLRSSKTISNLNSNGHFWPTVVWAHSNVEGYQTHSIHGVHGSKETCVNPRSVRRTVATRQRSARGALQQRVRVHQKADRKSRNWPLFLDSRT